MIAAAARRLLSHLRRPPQAPAGVTIYAVGDVHGRADLLAQLIRRIDEERNGSDGEAVIVMLGDYIDRGPASREVVDLLLAARDSGRASWRFLRGNHDQALLDFLRHPSTGPAWTRLGAAATLQSYGVTPPNRDGPQETWNAAALALSKALPAPHFHFLRSLESYCELGDYLFAHAGVRPGVPIHAQSDRDFLCIREPFLDDTRRLHKIVVHGHTPSPDVHIDGRRIGVDTGAYVSGILSAVRLRACEVAVIKARGPKAPDQDRV